MNSRVYMFLGVIMLVLTSTRCPFYCYEPDGEPNDDESFMVISNHTNDTVWAKMSTMAPYQKIKPHSKKSVMTQRDGSDALAQKKAKGDLGDSYMDFVEYWVIDMSPTIMVGNDTVPSINLMKSEFYNVKNATSISYRLPIVLNVSDKILLP